MNNETLQIILKILDTQVFKQLGQGIIVAMVLAFVYFMGTPLVTSVEKIPDKLDQVVQVVRDMQDRLIACLEYRSIANND